MDIIVTQPSATPVIQALRSIGYNAQTALADLVDNSLDANATDIRLYFNYSNGNGFIKVKDNGCGMDDEMLQIAMNIGSKDPRKSRNPSELGRFGMGLKTASFSLGKRLSVLSKRDGKYYQRCWDLDHVSDHNEWQLFREIPKEIESKIGDINGENGTIIYIDKLDRFIGAGTENLIQENSFYSKLRRIHGHIEFIFHSVLESEKVRMYVNDDPVIGWDPFLKTHPSTIEGESQVININGNKMKVKYYVLPHASYLNEQEYKKAGGNKGWRDQQGFYIYRENRLLYFGDWLGMFPKDTFAQLARIRIDLQNSADDDWQVDIKKSAVIPPDKAKSRLESISALVRKISRDIFYFRTQGNQTQQVFKGSLNTWEPSGKNEGQQFILNRNHPILSEILNKADEDTSRLLNLYLKFVQLGSPSNISNTPKVAEEDVQMISDSIKELVVQFSITLLKLDIVKNEEQLINALITQPAFDGLNRATLRFVLGEEKLNYDT
jgi:hypothetical protein